MDKINNLTITFEAQDAAEFGIEAAILISYLRFWINQNKVNGRNFKNKRWWTYNTQRAIAQKFTFMSERKIRRVLKQLEAVGAIQIDSFNRVGFDRTRWYSLDKRLERPCATFGHIDASKTGGSMRPKLAVPTAESAATIPVDKTVDKTVDKQDVKSAGKYFFEGKIVKLTEADYRAWEKRFPYVELEVRLSERDQFLATQKRRGQKISNWFLTTSNYLNNLNKRNDTRFI
jgi:hypothetical protein